jgi:pimeloyl-ACP methyl ester carboxylesterase
VPIQRNLRFSNPRGQQLAAVWHEPDHAAESAVVIAHGLLSSKDSNKHRTVCERLSKAGIAALRFDFAGRGESEGSLGELSVSGQLEDLRAAIAVAREQQLDTVSLIGSSLGGADSVLVAAEDDRIARLVTVAAPARLPATPRPAWNALEDPERGESVGPGFFEDAARHDVPAAATRIRCPWLVLHGAADEVVPSEDARLLSSASSNAVLAIHPQADHRFSDAAHLSWLLDRITEFVLQREQSRDRG